ncbi:MAG: DNA-processing protein DprA [Devosia sp.]|nr:DNA-processing protein DprA [Devosia sp.]
MAGRSDDTTLLTRSQRLAWLRLIRSENVGPVTFRQLLNRFGSAEAALEALPSLVRHAGIGTRLSSPGEAEAELEATEQMGARLVALGEPDYPALLKYISGAPPLVAIAGGDNLDWSRSIGIVGARNASAAGQKMTRMLAGDLGEAGYTIVSGLARGIDAAAHQASLKMGTVAVLAGGLDHIYPDENVPLAREIANHGGALITEMPLGWEPRARDFPRRNRLISGLSLGVVVVEAAKRSGSLITARLALEQNREVFAVPGSPLDPRAEGANHLIQQGAKLVTAAGDIIESLIDADPSRKTLLEPDWEPEFDYLPDPAELSLPSQDELTRLMDALSVTPIPVDALIAGTGLSVSDIQTLLFELDLAGRIEWSSGQLVALRG